MIKKILALMTAIVISYSSFGQSISTGIGVYSQGSSMFICPNASVKTWGLNTYGQLGLGDLIDRKLPTTIPILSDVKAISSGAGHTLFLKNNGTVWACGDNRSGEFGNGTKKSNPTPTQIIGLSGISKISTGLSYSLFLKNDGTVLSCGNNFFGQLGNGTSTAGTATPLQISGLTGIIEISARGAHSLFLKNDGTVWACGYNLDGQLGDGTNTDKTTPVQVIGITNVSAISAGGVHSLFLKSDNTVWSCGHSEFGQLGNGKFTDKTTPSQISGITGVTSISAGGGHSLFLKSDGSVWACGNNKEGQLGDGTNINKSTPVQITNITGATEISGGSAHSLFLKNDGSVWACGNSQYGQLGHGTNTGINTPVNLGNICAPPTPPQVNFSNFPTSLCVGSTINIEPTISGSNGDLSFTIDNSININAPKKIAKNSHAIFVLNGADSIMRYDLNGVLQYTYNVASTFTGLSAFAPDESDNVWICNAGRLVRLGPGGPSDTSSITSYPIFNGIKVTDMAFANAPIIENLIVVDTSGGYVFSGTDVNNPDPGTNNNLGLADSAITYLGVDKITSIAFDNYLYAEKRMLYADPQHNTLWQRRFTGGDWFTSVNHLIDTSITSGMALDFIDTDTSANFAGAAGSIITTSSSTKNIIGVAFTNVGPNGEINSFLDTSILSNIITQIPVGIVSASNNNLPQFWIADKGLNKLIKAQLILFRLTPNLPAGLKFNTISGKVEGTPTTTVAPQTYQLIVSNGLGFDTTYFTFGVTPTGPLNNTASTNNTSGVHNDGLTIKYYEQNNCGNLLEIADAIGGTSPGQTQISQTVYPLVSVIANDSLIRRVNSIRAENQDSLKVNVKLFYSYQDIQAFNLTRGSTLLSNDTIVGTMNMAVLQMHDKPNGSKEPIVHSPIAAVWSNINHHWVATVPVTKFSEFYGSDIGTLSNFDCSNTGSESLSINASYYVWNYDTLFTSNTYVKTLINETGCDSIATLNLALDPLGLSKASIGSLYSIHPNPSDGVFTISTNSITNSARKVSVLNVLGNVVYTTELNGNGKIDLSQQESGIYFLIIDTMDKPIIQRIIKQ